MDRGAGMYLNILWTTQVCLKLGVDKIQISEIFMALHSKIGLFQGIVLTCCVDKSPSPHMFRRRHEAKLQTAKLTVCVSMLKMYVPVNRIKTEGCLTLNG